MSMAGECGRLVRRALVGGGSAWSRWLVTATPQLPAADGRLLPQAALLSCAHKTYSTVPQQQPDWNRAVSDAEKIVGYPTSYLTLRSLLSDEMSNIAVHMRKLVGSSHPLLKTAKRLIYNGRNNMQTRGLIVLLISKAAGHLNPEELEQDQPAGVSISQRSLAEITEMIHTAHLIHKGVVNLSPKVFDGTTLQDMEFGNKIAILSGDYLLANACTGLAGLRNTMVVELISTAISDFMEAEFIGERDNQGNPVPDATINMHDWEEKNYLAAGSLMAKSCQAALVLAGHSEEMQRKGFEFGKEIALAWQAYSDLQPFTDLYRHPPGTAIDLTSAPVILHLQHDLSLLDLVNAAGRSMENCDFKKIHNMIMAGRGVQEAKDLCQSHAQAALDVLQDVIEPSDARTALENIINALRIY
ncbi:all trans-polyprenyl-diphosphate synthase PDSS2 [Procambarus clarkii]|uniref:all trans-polyprenyl-diphosphate synthase PDSS2 n=1 Tax=Procambarus clarkii TaxID=6728 RepID=UPI001E670EE8|nr:all trans-polyprenyl-diphosphate synthase PDSS2-like [Procambarus clarkii]